MLEMTNKQLEAIRGRIQDREVGTNGNCSHIYIDGKEADSSDVMFLIEGLVEEVERESKKGLICQDGEVHRFKMTYESPSVKNYYQVQECQKCGFRRLTNLLNA